MVRNIAKADVTCSALLERSSSPKKFWCCYADRFHGGIKMPNSDLLPSLLFKINQNQLALEAAIMELTLWVEQRGSGEAMERHDGARYAQG